MMKRNILSLFLRIPLLILLGTIYSFPLNAADSTIYFNDSSPDSIVLGNTEYWEAAFRKTNGSIIYILNKKTGGLVSLGNRIESLWRAELTNNKGFIDSRQWSSSGFSYIWSEEQKTLTFKYPSGTGSQLGLAVNVIFQISSENWFDMKLSLQVTGTADAVEYIHFPSDMVFSNSDIIEGLYPSMPGLLMKKSYFAQRPAYEATYPGYPGVFADFFWISSNGGSIAIYSIDNNDPLIPLRLGLYYSKINNSDCTYYLHKFGIWRWGGQTFDSPVVRVRIGQTKNEAAVSYRIDNSLDKYASLRDKLKDNFGIISASPEIKMDASVIKLPFDQYAVKFFPNIPAPSILHFAGFQKGGFDENTPDIFPPDSRYGTIDNYKDMVLNAKTFGFLSMPYTNPTWWDNESPTLLTLPSPLTIQDIAVITDRGKPLYESYNSRGGYTVCPWVPFVIERLKNSMEQMKTEVYSDIIFEDQIGARSWWFDFNASSPVITGYIDGWIEHTRMYKDNLLATEQGFDRLAETEIGFYGSVQALMKTGEAQKYWGTDTWEPFPLAQMMLRDKVFFYQHDLSDETMTFSKENLIWNLSFGCQLNYQITNSQKDDYEWLRMAGMFQRDVLSGYSDELITGFEYLDMDLSKTDFQNHTVYTNWNAKSARTIGKHTVSPLGAVVLANDGSLCAGIFAGYNGTALAYGDHYLIERREKNYILLKQPLGSDTPINIEILQDWQNTDRILVFTYLKSRKSFISVPSTVSGRFVNFNLARNISGEPVDIFLILNYR
jgi:hypothetical protein